MNTTLGDAVGPANAEKAIAKRPASSADLKIRGKSIAYKNYIPVMGWTPAMRGDCASLNFHEGRENTYCLLFRRHGGCRAATPEKTIPSRYLFGYDLNPSCRSCSFLRVTARSKSGF